MLTIVTHVSQHTPPDPHPAALHLSTCPNSSTTIMHCNNCGCDWPVPTSPYGEPLTEILGLDALKCPTCGNLELLYIQD